MNQFSTLVEDDKFKLFFNNVLVSETYFTIQEPDEFINETYATIYNLQTFTEFQNNGYATYLINQFFEYIKYKYITLIVHKNNQIAINLYYKCGFERFFEYDDSFSLIKRL